MKVPLSPYLAASRKVLTRLVGQLEGDYAYVSLLATDSSGMRYTVRKNTVSVQRSRWTERGCVVRVYDRGFYSEHSFNSGPGGPSPAAGAGSRGSRTPLSGSAAVEEQAKALAAEIRRHLERGAGRISEVPAELPSYPLIREQPLSGSWQGEVRILADKVGTEETVRRLTAVRDRAFCLSANLVDMELRFEHVRVAKLFLSGKKELEQAFLWSQGYLIPIARRDGKIRTMVRSFSGRKGAELIDEMEAGLEATVGLADALLDAGRVEPGEYEVILSPEAAGLLAHESFGHGVEMDMFVKRRAKAVEYLGRPVAAPAVTIHDGARAAEETGSYWFDDEGTPGSDTVVIDKGIFKTGISDLLSALRLQTAPTGNGRRDSFERKAYARMTNTFFSPGNDSLEEMIASIRHGYLLEKFLSGMEDPKNWGIQGEILYAREIRDGRLTGRLVSPVIMTGYVPDVLKSVSMVSRKLELSGSGMCGKGHKEYVKTSAGGPYLKTVMRLG